ncbi:MAG: uracil phosphoribosyltransferase [Flavobacteriaceae bacterium]|nr:uracil phosphoribosyltransferase [Flavobacteriaceae bacterium]
MQIHNLSDDPSVLNSFMFELRSVGIQNDRMRFRKNIERIGEILSYEMSRSLDYTPKTAQTPLGTKTVALASADIVICSILRAGLPLHLGILNYFDKAENAFISAYRKHDEQDPSQFEIIVEYIACPDLNNKILLIVDPMLASGRSIKLAYDALKPFGSPKQVHVLGVIGAKEGVDFISSNLPDNSHLWIGDIDDDLNSNAYIVPGLGDAGDLAYGTKLKQ